MTKVRKRTLNKIKIICAILVIIVAALVLKYTLEDNAFYDHPYMSLGFDFVVLSIFYMIITSMIPDEATICPHCGSITGSLYYTSEKIFGSNRPPPASLCMPCADYWDEKRTCGSCKKEWYVTVVRRQF